MARSTIVIGRGLVGLLVALALAMPPADALAGAPGDGAASMLPKPRPPEIASHKASHKDRVVRTLPRPRPDIAERGSLARWALADRTPHEAGPQPGEWTTSIVPDIEIGGDDDFEPVGSLGALMAPLGLEQLLLRLTHHF